MDNEQQRKPGLSKPAAYTLLATTTLGTAALAVTAPAALAAGAGSVGTSAAVFLTPFWRFVKRINELYVDTGMYVQADMERLRNKMGKPGKDAQEALAKHKARFSRSSAYSILGATLVSGGFLALYAPAVLATAAGSVIVSGASFTQPVIDLVRKVNSVCVDTFNYVRSDILKLKHQKAEPFKIDMGHELDQSISAPITGREKPWSRFQTYGILAAATVGAALLTVTAPSVLLAAAGTILGSAISYLSPTLNMMKRINSVYEQAEGHIVEDLAISDVLKRETMVGVKDPEIKVNKPMAYMIMGGLVLGGAAIAVYAPTLITAAFGAIAGAASSFTTPVLKQVGKVNYFYNDAKKYIKEDWQRIVGYDPELTKDPEMTRKIAGSLKQEASPKVDAPVAAPAEPAPVVAPEKPPVAPSTLTKEITPEFTKAVERKPVNDNQPAPQPVAEAVVKPKDNIAGGPKL